MTAKQGMQALVLVRNRPFGPISVVYTFRWSKAGIVRMLHLDGEWRIVKMQTDRTGIYRL
jgi:hypothetical protein